MKTVIVLSLLCAALAAADKAIDATEMEDVAEKTEGEADPNIAYSSRCSPPWVPGYGSRCYMLIRTRMTWFKAKEHCRVLSGHLASATDPRENTFLQYLTAGLSAVWLGGFNLQGHWMWIDGEGFYYTNWFSRRNESQYPCLFLYPTHGWSNTVCTQSAPFICSMKPSRS